MKSHELAKILLENPDVEIILQKDSEGNGYSPMTGADFDVIYVADTTYSGEVYSTTDDHEDHCLTKKEWESMKKKHSNKFVVFFPVN